jgi:hypothetical protein
MFIVKSSMGQTRHPKSETMLEAVYRHIRIFSAQRLDSAKVFNTRTKTAKELQDICLDADNIRRIQCSRTFDIAISEF